MSKLGRSGEVLVALLLVGTTAGCSTGPQAPDPQASASGVLASCGEYVLKQGESIPDEAVECMSAASGATLIVTAPTDEGDPTVRVYTALPGGSLDIRTDMTQDRFGGGTSHLICPEPVSIIDLGECHELPAE